jgi:hypothetical protein
MAPRVRITVDGKLALTIEQMAERLGVTTSTVRAYLTRYGHGISPAAELDGRKSLYLAKDIDRWWAARPGKGMPGQPRQRYSESA